MSTVEIKALDGAQMDMMCVMGAVTSLKRDGAMIVRGEMKPLAMAHYREMLREGYTLTDFRAHECLTVLVEEGAIEGFDTELVLKQIELDRARLAANETN